MSGGEGDAFCDATGDTSGAPLRCDRQPHHPAERHVEVGVATWIGSGADAEDVRWCIGYRAGRPVYRAESVHVGEVQSNG